MSDESSEKNTPSPKRADSLTFRVVIIGILALLLLLPLVFIVDIVNERGARYQSVLRDIASTWGEPQTLMAPVVIVPYTIMLEKEETVTDSDGNSQTVNKIVRRTHRAHFLPQSLNIDITLNDEIKSRGIFDSLVYTAQLSVDAQFNAFDVISLAGEIEKIHWGKAWIAIGLTDTKAINSVDTFVWNNTTIALSPGTQLETLPSGFHASVSAHGDKLAAQSDHVLKIEMSIKGSNAFQFAPFGETTNVTMRSRWPHPSFHGSALPDTHAISADGFSAQWEIPHLARNYPQQWSSHTSNPNLYEFKAGVSMFEPVSLYSQVTRSVKYGILFIGLTFLTLLIFELSIHQKLHTVQYALIGVSLSLFFLVLLSLSEHTSFFKAYISAALLTIVMISSYVWRALHSLARASIVTVMLASLYAILYFLLQHEDYALLLGTALLVVVLMIVMYVTRNISQKDTAMSLEK